MWYNTIVGGARSPETGKENQTMTNELIKRMNNVMTRLGGAIGITNLPDEVKEIITNCNDYETRVKMLEMCADKLGK